MAGQIAIVFGAGKQIGLCAVEEFKKKGYKVAAVARSLEAGERDGVLYIPADLTSLSTVGDAFEAVRKRWGEPSVVIYNAFRMYWTKESSTFDVPTDVFVKDMEVNTTSAFIALKEALASFATLPKEAPKTFIYTGNILNEGPLAGVLTLGMGKCASAHMVELADSRYRDQNTRFFFVDERDEHGVPMFTGASPQGHADMFLSLAHRSAGDVPWQITFVTGKGYVEFPHKVILPTDNSTYTTDTTKAVDSSVLGTSHTRH
ncbi:uncharacterized protein Z520_03959 [Fonsecaea multimorphosa CBS 102226]|uniref:NmrA-like domain-containing protein n=1 Tax=Fonsecaea multimorphosa CBS 102226 TaxID=1442371 RepID=A0A0D2KU42_9EURO|nr:uncharacterized protein Z520_03959 [Fonsecaea multimorphosa CBS 102226]KIY00274.1 hypothetical protein Z520_03959 [Fonsecaea multimorphosa CBS 102226]